MNVIRYNYSTTQIYESTQMSQHNLDLWFKLEHVCILNNEAVDYHARILVCNKMISVI